MTEEIPELGEYKFGFHDNAELEYTTGLGLTEEVIREISAAKNEPEWMLEFRLKSFEAFKKIDLPKWGPDLTDIDFNDIVYYQKPSAKAARNWEDVPQEIKKYF